MSFARLGLASAFVIGCGAGSLTVAAGHRDAPSAAPAAVDPHPAPVGGHPRFWLRAADLPELRRRAIDSNPIYAEVLAPRLATDRQADDEKFFPGGKPADPFPDAGGETLEAEPTEQHAAFFAFMSLVEPDPASRRDCAVRARRLLMYGINQAAQGVSPGAPFRDASFSTKDRARWTGALWPLTVDWIYSSLSASDKRQIRAVFSRWAAEQVEAFSWIRPAGVQQSPELTRDRLQLRWAANNYYQAAGRNLMLEAAVLDPDDDPDGALHAFLNESLGGFLYQTYHLFQEGDASGGVPVEGPFYYGAESTGFTAEWMLALTTAGYTDAARWGQQVRLATSDYWDKMMQFYPNAVAPESTVLPTLGYLGPVHWAAALEQTENQIVTGDHLPQLAPVALVARLDGNRELERRIRWFLTNILPGGPAGLSQSAGRSATAAILAFLLDDPEAAPAPDYRPMLPPAYQAPAARRLEARTDWTKDAAWFGTTCAWKSIDHQTDICGSFHFFRRGEWITKTRTGYSQSGLLDAPDYWNAIGVENDRVDVGDWQQIEFDRGGPIRGGGPDPSARASVESGYVFFDGDATGSYQSAEPPAHDVTRVSRSILWLKPDAIVTYDRVTTRTAGRFKRYNLLLPSAPRFPSATCALATTPRGQLLRVDALLPARAKLSLQPWEPDTQLAEPEPMRSRLRIEPDPRRPTPPDVRFLTVLQATDGRDPGPPALVVTDGRSPFQGVVVGRVVAFLAVEAKPASAVGLSFVLPPGVSTTVITGLAPGARYGIVKAGRTVTVTAGSAAVADEVGVLAF